VKSFCETRATVHVPDHCRRNGVRGPRDRESVAARIGRYRLSGACAPVALWCRDL